MSTPLERILAGRWRAGFRNDSQCIYYQPGDAASDADILIGMMYSQSVADSVAASHALDSARMARVLKMHYLMRIDCDQVAGRDNAVCQCSQVHLGWYLSIGEAVSSWVAHVMEMLGAPDPEPEREGDSGEPSGRAERIAAALRIAAKHGMTDGAHHKQWVIDQMVRALAGDRYEAWGFADDVWDAGIAP